MRPFNERFLSGLFLTPSSGGGTTDDISVASTLPWLSKLGFAESGGGGGA